MIKKLLLGLTVVAIAGAGVAIAQQTGIKRTPLQKLDFPAGYNTVTAIAEVPAGEAAVRGESNSEGSDTEGSDTEEGAEESADDESGNDTALEESGCPATDSDGNETWDRT